MELQRAQDELIKARSGEAGALVSNHTHSYTHKREKAKADKEAVEEIAKFKKLYTAGVQRLGKVQQENDKLTLDKDKLEREAKKLKEKLKAAQSQLESKRSVRPCTPAQQL